MEHKISKAQLEVWEWKEKAYEQIKDMPLKKALEFILKNTREIVAQIKRGQNTPSIVSEPKEKYGKK